MNLAENLKKIRKDNHLSQEQLADKLGVSRQSVSKWEGGQAYPEMDKMLKLCEMFNLNIDELLNQDVKQVTDEKKAKNNINKYIDDFLDYISKVIDMFSSMSFKEKIKCLLEQIIIIILIAIIFCIVGAICSPIVNDILNIFPVNIHFHFYNIITDIYIVASFILGAILLFHIFKVRYLDYYTIIKDDDITDYSNQSINKQEDNITQASINNSTNQKQTIFLQKRKEKVIIRDPEHSGYKFISGLLHFFLNILKIFITFIAIGFCLSLIFLVIGLVISFLFIKSGLFFIGSFITIISCIIINIIILDIFYNFITNQKNKKKILGLSFLSSLIAIGIGIGLITIGLTDFKITNSYNAKDYIKDETTIAMREDLVIHDYYNTKYIETNSNDIKITVTHSKYFDMYIDKSPSEIYFQLIPKDDDTMKVIKNIISDINNKQIVNYTDCEITIYTSKENIDKLKTNSEKLWQEE